MDARAFHHCSFYWNGLTWNGQTGDEAEMDAEGYIKVVFPVSLAAQQVPPDCHKR